MTNPYLRLVMGEDEESTAPAGVRNPYEEMLDASTRVEDQQRALALNNAFKVNPDEEAELRQLHERGKQSVMPSAPADSAIGRLQSAFPVPPSPNLIQDKAQFKTDLTMRELMSNISSAPALKRKYTQEDFATIASDDSMQLSMVERTIKGIGGRGFMTEFPRATMADLAFRKVSGETLSLTDEGRLLDATARVNELTAEQEGRGIISYALNIVGSTLGQLITGAPAGAAGAGVGAVTGAGIGAAGAAIGGQLGPQIATPEEIVTIPAATVTGALVGGKRGYAAGLAVHNFRQITGLSYLEYSNYRDINGQLMDPDIARGAALVVGALSTGTETFADITLSKSLPGFEKFLGKGGKEVAEQLLATDVGRSALSKLGRRVAETSGVEAVTEGVQGVIEILGGEAAKGIAEGEFAPITLEEAGARVGESVLQGAIGGAGVPIVTAPVTIPVEQYFINRQAAYAAMEARSAGGQLNRLQSAVDAAAQSKLVKRDRAALEEFVNEAAEGTELSNVFIAPDSFAQVAEELGVDVMELARQLGVADQVQDSALTSTPITMPVGKFIATVADTDLAGPLMEVAKLNPFLPSRAEIKAAQEAGEDQFVARAEALAAAVAQDETVRVEAEAISARIVGEMNAVGRFTGDANRVYATAATQMYVQLAQRLGISPQQAFDQYPLSVAGQRIGGPETETLGQGKGLVSAAVRIGGKTYTGRNHGEAVNEARADGQVVDDINETAGFVDGRGKFLRRDDPEAVYAAIAAGQLDRARQRVIEMALRRGDTVTLTSDMLTFEEGQTIGPEETFGQTEITQHADGTQIRVAEDVGRITVSSEYGEVKAYTKRDAVVVTGSFVEEGQRGQGIGTDLYQALANLAFERGQVLISDRSVTDQAAGAWRALAKRGYTVLENYVPGRAPDRVGGGGASPMGLNAFVALPPGKEDMTYAEAVGQLLSPAMRAVQAEMAADINEGAKRLGPKTLGQPKAPIFYSALSRFIENSKTTKAPASQWKGMITNAPGIKVEEVEMSGVMDWLDLQQGPVTREALAAFVAANGVTVEEVVRASSAAGNPRMDAIQREMLPLIEENDRILQDMNGLEDGPEMDALSERHRANYDRIQELRLERLDISSRDMDETKWGSWTLPGGQNYTELLLRLPTEIKAVQNWRVRRGDGQSAGLFGTEAEAQAWIDGNGTTPGFLRIEREPDSQIETGYRSSHWSELSVLAHVRFKERTGPNGERVLALEEIQSDWHQAGRERGYKSEDAEKIAAAERQDRISAAESRLANAEQVSGDIIRRVREFVQIHVPETWEATGRHPPDLSRVSDYELIFILDNVNQSRGQKYADDVRSDASRLKQELSPALQERSNSQRALEASRSPSPSTTVPNAPFKNNAWVDLVLKRMIRYAAENGFDSVAWIPGNTQNGRVVETDDNRSDFYDKIVPNAASKLGKKYGARVAQTPIDMPAQAKGTGWEDTGQPKQARDAGALQWWALPITPELRAVAMEEGFSLFARGRRGEYSPRLKEIRLNASADFSTFLHELGHHFLEVYDATALTLRDKEAAGETLTDGERGVLDDTRRLLTELARQTSTEVEGDVLDWWRGRAFEDRVQMHEQFARLTEAYFLDGKAPTPEMQSMFQTFKRWMLQVYSSLTELNVELNDEVRGILDRMVAAEADIKTAEENRGLNAMFATKPAFMTDEEWRGYQQLALAATQAAEDELTARSLRDMKWLSRAKAREIRKLQKEAAEQRAIVEAAVTAEVMSQPINRARTFLRKGINPDGTEVQGPHKLSIELLKAAYPDGEWKKLGYGRYGMLGKEGIDAEMAAELFGFESGDALIRALLDAEPAEATIEGETDRRMLEEFGDLVNEEAINRAADEALHNALRGRVLSAEYAALAKASGQRKMMAAAAQQIAKQVIGKQNAAKLKPQVYIAAERSAARKAEQALRRNDLVGAATAKRDQLLNFELAREAQRVLKQRNRTLDLFRRVTSAKRDTVSKTRNYDLVQVARAILAAHGMGRVRNAPIEYLDLLKRYDPRLYTSLEATLLVAVAKQKTIADLSVDEFLGLGDLIGQLWTLSREEKQIEIEGRKVELEQITTELTDRLATLGDTERGQIAEAATDAQKNLRSFVGLLASLRRVESWARSMDGGVVGPFTKYVFRPISEAADRYRADRNRLITKFRELFVAIEPTMGGKKIAAPELSYTFKNKAELLHAILHTGNASNKRKLLLGRQWGAERPDGTLDDSSWQKFLARMAQEGTLTKADFDFAQGVWDLLEETKPLAQATHRKVFGRYFAEITAEPVVTPFGTYAGGYVPAIYDQFFVGDAAVRAQQEQVEANDSTMFPSPASGFTKGRVEYNEVLELNLQLLPMHIDRVLKFAHLASPVRDVLRILRDKEFARGLEQVDPTAQSDMLLPWLQRASRQIVEEPSKGQAGRLADQFFRGVRNRSGMGLMFANLVNVAQQFTGFPLVLLRVKPQYVGAALARYVANPARMTKAARGASLMMVERGDNQMSAMYNAIEQIIDKKDLYGRTVDWFGRHTYFLQQAVQNVMDVIVWTGGYDQALARGESEAEAARQGDAAVRETQGSVFSEDISRIETGPAWARTFTHMYSYFSMWGNLLGGEVETTMREVGLRKGAGRLMFVYMIGFLAPAITAQLVADALRGQLPEDEEDDGYLDNWLSWFFMTQAKTAIAFAPIVGQAANATIGAFTAAPYDDRVGGSPAISAIEGAVRTPASVYEAVLAEGDKSRAVKDTLNLMTLLTGIPFQAAARPIGYAVDVAEGDIEPTSDLDYLRGLATGTASEASR